MADDRKIRSANLSVADKENIIELALKYRNIIENKKTDAVTAQDKETAWKKIAAEFNASSSAQRNHTQLKQVSQKKYSANGRITLHNTFQLH